MKPEKKEKMFRNTKKEDLVTVLVEIREIVDFDRNVEDLKQKLMQSKAYLEDEKLVKVFSNTAMEERMEEEWKQKIEEYKKKEEEYQNKAERRLEREQELKVARKKAEERRLETEHKLELVRKEAEERHLERKQELEFARIEARRKTENERNKA
ncbi:hypothetical protein TNCV_1492501 [Trichonephila clavipes]|nr:hypothetical protein TNCV_1492501 [Trichonephila clavipes]